ncbi:MAG TPA: hypothetical protein VLD39_18520 [Gammaproteobacteria bacterium]|nr:hypothetical protein [Gammaproteobacteria bacterium]
MTDAQERPEHAATRPDLATRIHRWVAIIIALVIGIDLVVFAIEGQWLNAFLATTIMTILVAPILLRDHLPVRLPAEMQLVALAFVFAALFLGEIRRYYERIWWWDIALHISSGWLLGIFGFLLVYVLNESRNVDLHMRPRFVAMFAFLFAVAVGALWEIFEFAMDAVFGTQMQKPMLDDPSGLTDTMWDLIVDTIGALCISTLGWWYMRRRETSFIEAWINKFIARNPRLFRT